MAFTMHNYLKLVFSKLDKSQNGKVSAFELKIYISKMNMPHVDDFVEELDSKGDSEFTLEEFVNLYLELLVRVNILMYLLMFTSIPIWKPKFGGYYIHYCSLPLFCTELVHPTCF